jgi:hypothetical protein
MVAGDVVYRRTHLIGVDIECRSDTQLETLAIEVLRYCLTEVTHAYDGHVHRLLAIEDVIDEVYQDLNVVTLLCVARKANEHKVATHLHSRDAMHTRQDVREDMCDTLRMTLNERTAVLAQSLDGLLWYRRGYIVICHVPFAYVLLNNDF